MAAAVPRFLAFCRAYLKRGDDKYKGTLMGYLGDLACGVPV